mmetsp:Transcript_44027/g.138944  ORF Transcript_44027/g.138944 Transcript_44027/m.138944 type:complete len:248 (-) Transcript_44027:845-1588(-)
MRFEDKVESSELLHRAVADPVVGCPLLAHDRVATAVQAGVIELPVCVAVRLHEVEDDRAPPHRLDFDARLHCVLAGSPTLNLVMLFRRGVAEGKDSFSSLLHRCQVEEDCHQPVVAAAPPLVTWIHLGVEEVVMHMVVLLEGVLEDLHVLRVRHRDADELLHPLTNLCDDRNLLVHEPGCLGRSDFVFHFLFPVGLVPLLQHRRWCKERCRGLDDLLALLGAKEVFHHEQTGGGGQALDLHGPRGRR